MTEWQEGYLAALEDAYTAIVARGLWSIALDEMIEDLRNDAEEVAAEAVLVDDAPV